VLTEKTGDGEQRQAFDVVAKLDPASCPARAAHRLERGREPVAGRGAAVRAAGRLILNLMPCVFPVLAMKAAAFARLAGHERSAMRRDGIAYTAGVLVAFGAMAAAVIAIRASVGEVELGLPVPVADLLAAGRLSVLRGRPQPRGVFEIGGGFTGMGQGLTAQSGATGAFFTGVLAVVVARPARPLHGGGAGFALSQPAPQTVAVLLAMGLGLALPYLALSMTPALQRLMPRPGAVDGPAAPVPRLPDVGLGGLDDLGADPADRPDGVIYALGGMILIGFAIWLLRLGSVGTLGAWLRRGLAAAPCCWPSPPC
jgi:thiol:disulfide interchange protein DsbD